MIRIKFWYPNEEGESWTGDYATDEEAAEACWDAQCDGARYQVLGETHE